MQNMHQHSLTPDFVVGDKRFHAAGGERLLKVVLFSEFHCSTVVPFTIDRGFSCSKGGVPVEARAPDYFFGTRTPTQDYTSSRPGNREESGGGNLRSKPGRNDGPGFLWHQSAIALRPEFSLTCTVAGIRIAITPTPGDLCPKHSGEAESVIIAGC